MFQILFFDVFDGLQVQDDFFAPSTSLWNEVRKIRNYQENIQNFTFNSIRLYGLGKNKIPYRILDKTYAVILILYLIIFRYLFYNLALVTNVLEISCSWNCIVYEVLNWSPLQLIAVLQ